jgi:hypothetical protein
MPPATFPYGARLRERTQPLAPDDDRYGYAHWILCESIGRIFLELQEVFDPDDPGLPPVAPILSVDLCPDWALPWLAQFVGVQLPVGIAPDAAREAIRSVAGWSRGTPAALRAAAAFFLTGDKTVYFRERDGGNAYVLEVVTITAETPDPAQVLAALTAQKPGGIVMTYRTVEGWDYEQIILTGNTYAYLTTTYATYDALRRNEPT